MLWRIKILELEYDPVEKAAYKSGIPPTSWEPLPEKKYGFDAGRKKKDGKPDSSLFAQECLMIRLREEGYEAVTWFKLTTEPRETRGKDSPPEFLEFRQQQIRDQIGEAPFLALAPALT